MEDRTASHLMSDSKRLSSTLGNRSNQSLPGDNDRPPVSNVYQSTVQQPTTCTYCRTGLFRNRKFSRISTIQSRFIVGLPLWIKFYISHYFTIIRHHSSSFAILIRTVFHEYGDFSWKFVNNGGYNLSIPAIFDEDSRKFAGQFIRVNRFHKSHNSFM